MECLEVKVDFLVVPVCFVFISQYIKIFGHVFLFLDDARATVLTTEEMRVNTEVKYGGKIL